MASNQEELNSPPPAEEEEQSNKKDYELLREDHPNYDLSFKVIVIGNSGK